MNRTQVALLASAVVAVFGCHYPNNYSPRYSEGAVDMNAWEADNPQFQDLSLKAPATVFVKEIERGTSIGSGGDNPSQITYESTLPIEGRFSTFVPDGKQEEIWAHLSDKVDIVVRDLKTGQVQKTNGRQHGWNLERRGVSVTWASPDYPEFDYSSMPSQVIDTQHFNVELFDLLPIMPEPGTTLEIHAEYKGFVSDAVRVDVLLKVE